MKETPAARGRSTSPREVPLTAKERQVAHDWHGGMGSMMYAAASSGALRLGPRYEGVSEAEQWWDITDRLMREAQSTVSEAKRRGPKGDVSVLSSIARKAEKAAKAAKEEVEREQARSVGELTPSEAQQWVGGMAERRRQLEASLTSGKIEQDVARVSGVGRGGRSRGRGRG